MQIRIDVDIRGAVRMIDLTQRAIASAAAAALNDTANSVRGAAVKDIAATTGLKQPDIRTRLWIKRATRAGLVAEVGALPSARNVGKYPKAKPQQQAGGVALTAWGKRQTYRGAFVMGGKRARPDAAVWRRTGKATHAVTPITYGPSVRQEFKRSMPKLEAVARERFPVFFQRRLRGALIRAGLNPDGASGI